MFKKIINKIIMGTKCYLALKEHCSKQEKEIEAGQGILNAYLDTLEVQGNVIVKNKTTARKIVRLLNANFDKKNGTIKQVKALCNEIIKGE